MKHIVCVGAVYIDTILTVPYYPAEDQKLRASKLTRRRGGNTANSLEVLTQLLTHGNDEDLEKNGHNTQLHLVSVLPDEESAAVDFIHKSIPNVNLSSCIFRKGMTEAASSYIIKSEEKHTRTIVNINELPEMTSTEFISQVVNLTEVNNVKEGWYHFEGRTPDVLLECVKYIRSTKKHQRMKISVECEKPDREGMKTVAQCADIVFYSKLWAETRGFTNARTFLESQLSETQNDALLCCTWGDGGATIVQKAQEMQWASVPSWKPPMDEGINSPVVDTIGAGDTFIAGMLYAIVCQEHWPLRKKLEFANELAGRKVFQDGFSKLGPQIMALPSWGGS